MLKSNQKTITNILPESEKDQFLFSNSMGNVCI